VTEPFSSLDSGGLYDLIDSYYELSKDEKRNGTNLAEFYEHLEGIYQNLIGQLRKERCDLEQIINCLLLINRVPMASEASTITEAIVRNCESEHEYFIGILAQQFGHELFNQVISTVPALTSGPDLKIKIKPERVSKWPYAKWRELTDFSKYAIKNDCVTYRGLQINPGDVFCCETTIDSGGIFASAYDANFKFTHVGVYVPLVHEGKTFPAICEIHEHGVRAVPLSTFLAPEYITFAEHYRPKAKINPTMLHAVVQDLLSRDTHFDFIGDSRAGEGFTCSSLIWCILDKSSEQRLTTKYYQYSEVAKQSLGKLGQMVFLPQITPDSLSDPGEFNLVGHIFCEGVIKLKKKRKIASEFGKLFQNNVIFASRPNGGLELAIKVVNRLDKIRVIRRGILYLFGFPRMSLEPNASLGLLAIIFYLEHRFHRALSVCSDENDALGSLIGSIF
jgi:hypothetical protein